MIKRKGAFNYEKLKREIVKKFGSYSKFAEQMEISPAMLGSLLANNKNWTQENIVKATNLLEIPKKKVYEFFLDLEID